MKVLAIDPGFDRLGVAVLEGDPSKPTVLWSDCITPEKGELASRLAKVSSTIWHAIDEYKPDAVAVETLFFSKNVKTAMGVAHARGAILATTGNASVPVIECSPQEVKLAVTGHGKADKRAIARMVPKLVRLPSKRRTDDEFDAIALGIAALARGFRH